jgi:hypothetical protein
MSTSTIKVISVLGVASALIPLLGKAKSEGKYSRLGILNVHIVYFSKLPTQPAMAT